MMKMKLIPKFPIVEPVGPHTAYHWGVTWDVSEVADANGLKVRIATAEVEDDIGESLKVSGRAIPFDESTDSHALKEAAPVKEPDPRPGMPKSKEPAPKS